MKKCFIFQLILLYSLSNVAFSVPNNASQLPDHLRYQLDKHKSELHKLWDQWSFHGHYSDKESGIGGLNVCQRNWLPGYFIKFGIDRVPNAQKLDNLIKKHHKSYVSVANKFIYDTGNNQCLVIAQEVEGQLGHDPKTKTDNPSVLLNINQTKDLHFVAKKGLHEDLHPRNYVITPGGQVVIIDTDYHAMPIEKNYVKKLYQYLTNFHVNRFYYLNNNKYFNKFDPEALRWVNSMKRRRTGALASIAIGSVAGIYALTNYILSSKKSTIAKSQEN